MKKWLTVFFIFASLAVFSAGMAMANGTLTATVLYSGQPLQNAYAYLQSGSRLSPREQYYQSAAYLLGPSDSSGNISASVPEGAYYVRIIRRANFTPNPSGYLSPVSHDLAAIGPPYPGDYTWFYPGTITITTNGAVNLGTVNTTIYGAQSGQPMTISGTVRGASGRLLAGWAVKATNVPCESGDWAYAHSFNECGQSKIAAFTDSSGNYTITVYNTGNYYVYASPKLNFGNPNYPGGYPTCQAGVGCEACGDYFYYNCPVNVTGAVTGENIVVPGY